jgi:predicted phosphoadenosine phosphosulfate sulfurtransferase
MNKRNANKLVRQYVDYWTRNCYLNGIPDEVPDCLLKTGHVPSWKLIALCLLRNDMNLTGLGFTPQISRWYVVLKQIELKKDELKQRMLF